MEIAPQLERITIFFQVTPELKRFVHVYMIMGEKVHLVDAGVFGALDSIGERLAAKGRAPGEIASLFLTHSHPDHIGDGRRIKDLSGCTVYAGKKEKAWIEDIALQFQERPIPNFHSLLPFSVRVDRCIEEGELIALEPGISIKVFEMPGHSPGSLAFFWQERGILFTGDIIPVKGGIPIYTEARASMQSLERLRAMEGVSLYLPAWDEAYDGKTGKKVLDEALGFLGRIDEIVREIVAKTGAEDMDAIMNALSGFPELETFASLPLFRRSLAANVRESVLGA
ncbi:MBL fold metallo-hydrolase [Desulfococcaceae bacterium OttesenSCG-928-F15]|nr:MBL fold metallo-hydrolase [Desulfococcaceae bacterium OttesenSCG-928-F15]